MTITLSDELYERFRDLLLNRCGLSYPERKRHDLAHSIEMALPAAHLSTPGELYADIMAGGQGWEILLDQITVGETYFFRNGPQIEAIRRHLLPEIMDRRATFPEGARNLRIWSAGCATGEEPYSLAMVLSDLIPNHDAWNLSILATDINPRFLAFAREGLYSQWSFRETPDETRERFFEREHNRWRLRAQIRRMVSFMRLNLAEPAYPSITNGTVAMDLILCRNVTIYFDEATTRQVAERFYAALAPGGWLVVGHAEPNAVTYRRFEVHNYPSAVIYRKPLDAPLFASAQPAEPRRQAGAAGPAARQPAGQRATAPASGQPKLPAKQPQSAGRQPSATASPERPPPDPWEQIHAQLAQGQKGEAERLLQALLAKEPDNAKALAATARLIADRGNLDEALSYCARAIEKDTLCLDAHYLMGQIYEHQGDADAALSAYRRTVYLQPDFVPGLIGMGNIWSLLGRTPDARRCFRNALKFLEPLAPQSPIANTDGTTAADLRELIARQLQQLG